MIKDPNVVVIGGGTGSFTLLQELKKHTKNIIALVNMADDGGSTGVLRDEFGVLPPGDIRQCLVALSKTSEDLRALFSYRYAPGTKWEGHSFGNLFLSTVEMMTQDFGEAVRLASRVLNIRGKVVPITLDNCKLVAQVKNRKIRGQFNIAETQFDGLNQPPELWLEPNAKINPEAEAAINDADMVVIAPGNLYASLLPALLVDGAKQALNKKRDIPVVYVCNLVNKPNHTADFAVHNYVSEIERFLGEGVINTVLYNNIEPTIDLLEKYALDGEFPVKIDDKQLKKAAYHAIGGDFLAKTGARRDKNDTFIYRSLIRHNAKKLCESLFTLL